MERKRERRVLAIILAILMVISLILPGTGSISRNDVYAADNDITSFLRGVDLYEAGSSTPKDVAWLIDSEKTYGMHVNFAESDAGNVQFHMDPDNRTFTYAFPAGVKITQVHSPLTILINDSQSIDGTTYAPTLVGDHYEITGTFADDASLRDSRNVKFYLDFDVQFDEGLNELDFGNNVKIPVQYDTESKVTVAKTGFYSTDDGKAHFTVTVNSKRTNNNVKVKDTLTGTAFTGLTIDSITSGGADYSGSVNSNVTADGFDITIPTMTDGQSVVINYSVDIDYSQVSGEGTGTETGNTVDVTSNEDPDPDPVPYNLQNKITYANLGKSASSSSLNADGSKTITYTVNYNDYCIVPMNGVTLTDIIDGTGITYPADLKLNIARYGKNGALVSEEEVSPATLSDTKWTYQLNDTTPYKYVITYEVTVPATEMTANKTINNTIEDGRGHKGTTGITVGPEALSLTKSASDVDTVNKEITWKLIVAVPKAGLGVNTTITDSVPTNWVDGTEVVEHLVPGSLSLLSNSTGGALNYSVAEDADQKKFVISFPDGIANTTGTDQTVEFEYKTVISDEWVAKSATETWMQDHNNTAEIRSGNQTGRTSATAKVVPPTIEKKSAGKAADGSGYPVYKFEVIVANPTVPLILEDTFDPELELVTTDTSYAYAPRIYSGGQYYQGDNETAILPGDISTGEGSFRMSLDQSYIYGSNTHYRITYALKVKSTGAYRRLAQRVADTGHDKITLKNTAKVGEVSDDLDFDFEYAPITKTLTNAAQFPETGEGVSLYSAIAKYQVVINPLGLTLNNGEPMTATDTYTNLALDYTTIKFDPADAGITCSASGNVLTIRNIPDGTPITVTYSSRPSGTQGADGKLTISNEFETSGHLAVSTKSFKVKADAGGTGSIRHIKIFKHDDANLLKGLKGASFKLYDSTKTPMKWKAGSSMGDPTEDVVITTNQNGIAVLSQYDVDFMSSDDTYKNVYYLKEIKAPDGYMIRDTWYQFMLIEGTDPDYTKFEYVDGDIMKIRNNKPNFYFTKVNENDEPLAGAEFTLYDVSKTSLGITAVSDAQGNVSFTDIPVAATGDTTIYVKETAVPDPQYVLDETYYKIVFTHDADGNLREKERDIPARFPNTKDEPKTSFTFEKKLDTTSVAGTAVEATVKAQTFPIDFVLSAPTGKTIPASVTAAITKADGTTENRVINLTNDAGTISLADGESAKISGLPRGTEYLVTETENRTLIAKGFTYDNAAVSPGYSGTLANDGTTKVTVTNSYDMPKTSLKVTKIWDDQNDKYSLRPASVDVQLKGTVNGTASNVGAAVTLNDANSWTCTWTGLDKFDADLNAITYSVEETTATKTAIQVNYTAGDPAAVQDTTVDAAYTITNTLKTGSILVKKDFVVPSDVSIPNNAKFDLTFQVKRGDTVYATFTWKDLYIKLSTGHQGYTVSGLPLANDYKITETNADGLFATYNLVIDEANSTITKENVAVAQGSTTEVTLTNTYKKLEGGIALKAFKNVNGTEVTAGSDYDSKFSFTLEETTTGNVADKLTAAQTKTNAANAVSFDTISYTEPAVHTYKITEGAVVGMPEIATDGTEFTVTVTVAQDANDASKLVASVTKVEKTTAAGTETVPYANGVGITFNNIKEKKGDLKLSKVLVSDLAADADQVFNFTVTLDDTTISGTYGGMTFDQGVATVVLKGGEQKTAVGLPEGVGYTITEASADGFVNTGKTGEAGIISEAQRSEAAFTNTRETGNLKVSKMVVSSTASDKQINFTFTVTLSDTTISGTYGEMTFTNGVATFTLKDGESRTAEGLPTTVQYTVTEQADAAFVTTSTGSTGAISTTEAEAEFTNTKDEGGLIVSKTVVSDLAADHQKEFDFTVTLDDDTVNGTYGDMTFTNGVATFTLKDGETKSATGLAKGIGYTVTEDADNLFVTTKTGETGTIGDTAQTAAFTNTRKTGELEVSKTVSSPVAGDLTKTFGFTVTLDDDTINGTFGDMEFTAGVATFDLASGETKSATGLPQAVGYTVTETADNDFNVTKTGDTGTISDTKSTAEFTNTRKTGRIKITKEFVIPSDVTVPNSAKFDLTFQVKRGDTVYKTFTWQDLYTVLSTGGDGYVVDYLPLANDYKVVETNASGLFAAYNLVIDEANSTMTKENIAVTDGATTTVSLTNTYKKMAGGIALKAFKNVNGSAVTAGSTYDDKFSFTLSDDAGRVLQTKSNAANVVAFNVINYFETGVHTYKIAEAPVIGMPDIATDGTEYTVTVTVAQDANDASKLVANVTKVEKTTAAGTETVAYADGVGITFNNIEAKKGDLEVSKELISDLAADADQEFTFTVTLDDATITGTYGEMTFDQGVATIVLKGGEQKTAVGLPVGVGYTVTEGSVTGFTNTGKTGDTGTISETQKSEAEFTNTRDTGDLKVSKAVVSNVAADKQKNFTFTVTLSDTTISGTYGDMTFTNGVATFTLKDGESKTATGLPTTVQYTVTEQDDAEFITTASGDTGAISVDQAEAEFTNTKNEGTLKITKTIKGDVTPEEAAGQLQFTITDEAGDVLVIDGKRMENLILANDFTKNGDIYELELTVPAGRKYVVSEVIYDVDGAILESVTANAVALDKTNGVYSMLTEEVAVGQGTVAAYEDTYKKGSLLITKTIKGDVTPEEADGQLEFTITNETTGDSVVVNLTQFDFDQITGVYSYEIEARPGDIYTVTETDYDVDGAILETVTHQIMAGPEEEGATATNIVISSTEQTRVDFADDYKADEGVVHFTKYGYVNELCSPLADEIQPLKGVVFQAENINDDKEFYLAQSNADGLVEFMPMPAGTYKIWEVHCPEEYVLDDTVYYVTIANGTVSEITTEDGTPIEKNRIINEPLRADLEFTKVSEDEPTRTLEGSTYALFVESGDGSVTMIAQRTTGKDGKVKFEGVLPGKKYSLKEMTSPDGYYVSKNTVRITFKVDTDEQGEPVLIIDDASVDNGDGTVTIDANGNVTWLEPVVVAKITKITKDGKLLAGATLRVEDEDGNVIIPEWVTGEAETEISGKLIVGHTYRLVEVKAPAGYALAGPVSFTVSNDEVGPDEGRVIKVSMIDEELPPETPPDVPKTSDDTPLLPVAGLMALSLAGATVVGAKKRKLKKDNKK